jgi:hypothetical protein
VRRGKLILRLDGDLPPSAPPVQVLDLYGNELQRTRDGRIVLPLGPEPIFVRFDFPTKLFSAACRTAVTEEFTPLAVQLLPLTQRPGRVLLPVRVQLHNIAPQALAGTLRLTPPPGWKLALDVGSFQLAPGETRTVAFTATQSATAGETTWTLNAATRSERWQWRQEMPVAVATNWTAGQRVRIDGESTEWQDAAWLSGDGTAGTQTIVNGRVALRWDTTRLYIAARVIEPKLRPRREEGSYRFWDGYDALQIAFGVRETREKYFGGSPAGDMNYGFLLSPFRATSTGAEGRVLRLWSPTLPFGATLDTTRWGGAVPGAQCAVRRVAGVTFYEASIPLNEIRELRPASRVARGVVPDVPVRFAWMLHNDDRRAVVWPARNFGFDWELDSRSLFPPGRIAPVVPALLGWEQSGRLAGDAQVKIVAPRPRQQLPARRPPVGLVTTETTATPRRRDDNSSEPRPTRTNGGPVRSGPPEIEPMSPTVLPPAATPEGRLLPPQAP